jgi:hypothetical protein
MRHADKFLRHPSTRMGCVWMVALALLLGVLSPMLTPASQGDSGTWVQVCSGIGIKLVRIDDTQKDRPDGNSKSAGTMSDCPYCRLHFTLALPPAPVPDVVRLERRPPAFDGTHKELQWPAPS